jgi:hypothetical protein
MTTNFPQFNQLRIETDTSASSLFSNFILTLEVAEDFCFWTQRIDFAVIAGVDDMGDPIWDEILGT